MDALILTRPRSLTILAWIFIVCGASAVWKMVDDLLSDSLSINLAFLMIPVGFGLLKGRASSVKWAKIWVGLFAALVVVLTGGYVFWGDSYHVHWFNRELVGIQRHLMVALSAFALLGLFLLGWKILVSSAVRAFVDSWAPQAPVDAVGGPDRA